MIAKRIMRLTASHIHVSCHGAAQARAIDHKIMAPRLASDRLPQCLMKKFVAFGSAQRPAKVMGVLLPEAHIQRARARHSDTIARLAEVVAEWGDEADSTACLLHANITSRAACPMGNIHQLHLAHCLSQGAKPLWKG